MAAAVSPTTITIVVESKRYDIDAEGCQKWQELRDELRAMEDDGKKIWSSEEFVMYSKDDKELNPDDKIQFNTVVTLKPRLVKVWIKVINDGHKEVMQVDKTATILQIKEKYVAAVKANDGSDKKKKGKKGKDKKSADDDADSKSSGNDATDRKLDTSKPWSYHGRRLVDEAALASCGIAELEAGTAEIIGRFSIIVNDELNELNDQVDVYDWMSRSHLQSEYLLKRKRVVLLGARFLYMNSEGKEVTLDDEQTLYDQGVRLPGTTVIFTNPAFKVRLRDPALSAAARLRNAPYGGRDMKDGDDTGIYEVINVFDSDDVGTIRNKFNDKYGTNQSELLLQEDDTLMLRDEEMEPKKPLYRYPVWNNEVEIIIKRQEVGQAAVKYICSDCGEEVRLKKTDEVRCRQCGYRIVYKKRTQQACQYLAR